MELVAAVDPLHAGIDLGQLGVHGTSVQIAAEAHRARGRGRAGRGRLHRARRGPREPRVVRGATACTRSSARPASPRPSSPISPSVRRVRRQRGDRAELRDRRGADDAVRGAGGAVLRERRDHRAAPRPEDRRAVGHRHAHRAAHRGGVEGLGRRPDHQGRRRGRARRARRRHPGALGADAGHGRAARRCCSAPPARACRSATTRYDRSSFMPGVLLAVRKVADTPGPHRSASTHCSASDVLTGSYSRASFRQLPGGEPVALLSVEDVRVEFGGIVALADLSFTIDEGQICALIGPNGAGKTTLFNCVSRLYQPTSGAILFDGREPAARCPRTASRRSGSRARSRTSRCSRRCRVLDNVLVGAHSRGGSRERQAPGRGARASSSGSSLDRPRRPARGRAAVRHAQAHRDRACARGPAAAAAARRAGRGPHALRGRRAGRPDPLAARRVRPQRAARRAPHGDGHVDLRQDRRARLRFEDRRRHARRRSATTHASSRRTSGSRPPRDRRAA